MPPEGTVDVWIGEDGGGWLRFFGLSNRQRAPVASLEAAWSRRTNVYEDGFRISAALGYSSEGGAADVDSRPIFAPAAPPADCDEGIAVLVAELLGELSCDESGMEGAVQRLQAQQAELAAQYGQASAPPVNPELEEALRALDDRVREVGRLSMLRATCCSTHL